jgi:hypothetical protein
MLVETIIIYPDMGLDMSLDLLYTIVVNRYKTQMTVTTNDRGQQNMWAKEPTMYYENYGMDTPNQVKEKYNGRWAMLGIIAGALSYSLTGKLFFGIF